MIRRNWMLALVGGIVIGGTLFSPIGPLPSDPAARASTSMGESFGLNFRGTAQREPTAADHFQYSNPIYSLANGEKVGTATYHVVFADKPMVLDHTITFRLPDGDLIAQQLESFGPDMQYPAAADLIGIHPKHKTIDPKRSTGAYKGRTGKLRMAGWHENSNFLVEVTFDDFYWIELDPQ